MNLNKIAVTTRNHPQRNRNRKYDAEADILMFIMLDQPPSNAISEPGGIIVSYTNEPVSIEFLNAFKRQLFNPATMNLTISS